MANNFFESRDIVIDPVVDGGVSPIESRIVTVDTNGIGIGAILHISADGHFDLAKADAVSTSTILVAMALEAGTGTKRVMRRGFIYKADWGFSPDVTKPVFLSNATAGILTQADITGAGHVSRIMGFFHEASGTAGLFEFCPETGHNELS